MADNGFLSVVLLRTFEILVCRLFVLEDINLAAVFREGVRLTAVIILWNSANSADSREQPSQ